jgi:hypothetical protein
MPKVPLPTKIPESISPTLWQNVNRRDILSFLSDHGGTYLFYSVMKNDPDPDNSSASKNCAAVQCDVIMLVANGYQVGTQHICNCTKQQADDWSESKFYREICEN